MYVLMATFSLLCLLFLFLYSFCWSGCYCSSNVLIAIHCFLVFLSLVFDRTGTEPLPRCLSINCFPVQYINVTCCSPCCCLTEMHPEGAGVKESLSHSSGIHCMSPFPYASDFSSGSRGEWVCLTAGLKSQQKRFFFPHQQTRPVDQRALEDSKFWHAASRGWFWSIDEWSFCVACKVEEGLAKT